MHRPIGKDRVGAVRMKAVELTVVGAVDGTRSRTCLSILSRTLNGEGISESTPATAREILTRTCPPRQPLSWPAGILGQQDRVRGAVGNGFDAGKDVQFQGSLVAAYGHEAVLLRRRALKDLHVSGRHRLVA